MLPSVSTATSRGLFSVVLVAWTSSTEVEASPPPATVVMIPVLTVIFRILLLNWSAKKMFPDLSNAIPRGL
jgi:hypothetical protein